jgi:hypothetical protein
MRMSNGFLGRRQAGRGSPAFRRISRLTSALVEQWSEHSEAQDYLRLQWGERVLNAHNAGRRAQKAFYLARWLVVIGATVVPTLVAVGARASGTLATVSLVAAIVLSLLVAIAASAVQVQAGQRWRMFSQFQAELEHAGWQLYERRGDYTDWDVDQRFAAFVDRIERIVHAYQTGSQLGPLNRAEGYATTPDPLIPDWQWP